MAIDRLNLNLKSCHVVPITSAIRARKGDYLVVSQDGETTVVGKSAYSALVRLEESLTPKPPRKKQAINGTTVEQVNKQIIDLMESVAEPLLTGEIVDRLWPNEPERKSATFLSAVTRSCRMLTEQGRMEVRQHRALDRGGKMRTQLQWKLAPKSNGWDVDAAGYAAIGWASKQDELAF